MRKKAVMHGITHYAFVACVALAAQLAHGAHRYVDAASPAPAAPFTNWSIAARTIQDAVDAAAPLDEIIVTNGVYDKGERTLDGGVPNRVAIDKPVHVRSVNGPLVTSIVGSSLGIYGGVSCRGVYLTNGAALSGFTITNGGTGVGWAVQNICGGGVYSERLGVVSNCMILGNTSFESGGGAYGGKYVDCVFKYNQAGRSYIVTPPADAKGGGVARADLVRCRVEGNRAPGGGGAAFVYAENCLIAGNNAGSEGGGLFGGNLLNCTVVGNNAKNVGGVVEASLLNSIVYHNGAETNPNHCCSEARFSCTTPLLPGGGNIDLDPFVAAESGFLLPVSPCINSGGYPGGEIDLYGNPRVAGGRIDMGATEFQQPWSSIPQHWLWSHGLMPAQGIDAADSDNDGASTLHEWVADTNPTNRASVFKILSVTNQPSIGLVIPTSQNCSYWLEGATNLNGVVQWTVVPNTSWTGSGGVITLYDPRTNAAQFYRAAVKRR